MPAKLVVTARKGGSRISLLGSSGKELLVSTVFAEPRAKGATLRALKGLLGEVTIEDHTLAGPGRAKSAEPETTPAPTTSTRPRSAAKAPRSKSSSSRAAASKESPAKPAAARSTRAAKGTRGSSRSTPSAAQAARAAATQRQAAARLASTTKTARV